MSEASLDKLQVSLERVISRWMDKEASKDDSCGAIGYVGDNISRHMTAAAMVVLRTANDLYQYQLWK